MTPAMLTALPVTVTLIGLVGVLVTSATLELFGGDVMWNPLLVSLNFVAGEEEENFTKWWTNRCYNMCSNSNIHPSVALGLSSLVLV